MITWCLCFLEICSAIPTALHFQYFCILLIKKSLHSHACLEYCGSSHLLLHAIGISILFKICTVFGVLLLLILWKPIIDNHHSGYLGMAVQLYVQAHLGHYHILTQKEYSQKLMAQLKSTRLLTYICII